ncbi:MAG TPA: alpha-L-fucosidase [Verrucomicrobiae bacterium]|nr:alpha-L-fucosidase [Verrucomicrobiae bacterium]
MKQIVLLFLAALVAATGSAQTNQVAPKPGALENVQAEHDAIGDAASTNTQAHTLNPGAQWYPDAGLGLFIHWGIASVKGINISWSMRDGLGGKPAQITPDNYFAMAKDFDPTNYNPDKWIKAAKDAGFTYVVLTTRHHEGFALWPSDYGDFSTKNFMGGRDLLKPYVDACRKYGLKVGFYYSPPDWYFDRDYLNFSMRKDSPPLGPDLKPRTEEKTPDEIAAHDKAYADLVRGQLTELLTRYGKIDLLWFDGKIPGATGEEVMPISEIRKLQPGIVINGRFHGHGDFINYERTLTATKPANGWAEYCNTWSAYWSYVTGAKYRANGFVLGQFVTCRSLHINYLLDVGPMSDGELPAEVYSNLAVVGDWMKVNGESVHGVSPLPAGESANVPATAHDFLKDGPHYTARYLFALPKFKSESAVYPEDLLPPQDATLTFTGKLGRPYSATLLRDGSKLDFTYTNGVVTVQLPASKRSDLVDVVKLEFPFLVPD